MTRSEYQELADFFVEQLGRTKEETRVIIQGSVESLRDEIRVVADGVLTNGRRIEENGRRIEALGDRVDALTHRVGSLEETVSRGFSDHDARIRALE